MQGRGPESLTLRLLQECGREGLVGCKIKFLNFLEFGTDDGCMGYLGAQLSGPRILPRAWPPPPPRCPHPCLGSEPKVHSAAAGEEEAAWSRPAARAAAGAPAAGGVGGGRRGRARPAPRRCPRGPRGPVAAAWVGAAAADGAVRALGVRPAPRDPRARVAAAQAPPPDAHPHPDGPARPPPPGRAATLRRAGARSASRTQGSGRRQRGARGRVCSAGRPGRGGGGGRAPRLRGSAGPAAAGLQRCGRSGAARRVGGGGERRAGAWAALEPSGAAAALGARGPRASGAVVGSSGGRVSLCPAGTSLPARPPCVRPRVPPPRPLAVPRPGARPRRAGTRAVGADAAAGWWRGCPRRAVPGAGWSPGCGCCCSAVRGRRRASRSSRPAREPSTSTSSWTSECLGGAVVFWRRPWRGRGGDTRLRERPGEGAGARRRGSVRPRPRAQGSAVGAGGRGLWAGCGRCWLVRVHPRSADRPALGPSAFAPSSWLHFAGPILVPALPPEPAKRQVDRLQAVCISREGRLCLFRGGGILLRALGQVVPRAVGFPETQAPRESRAPTRVQPPGL